MFSELTGGVWRGSEAGNEKSLQVEPGLGRFMVLGPTFSTLAPMGKSETARKVLEIPDIQTL